MSIGLSAGCGDDDGGPGDGGTGDASGITGDGSVGSDGSPCSLGQDGDSCTYNSDCCSSFCHNGECAPSPTNCDVAGTVCSTGATCCSGRCEDDGTGGFAPAGEICEGGSNECCPGNPDGQQYCLPTTEGVLRRFATGDCVPDGDQCVNPEDCCSGVCEGGVCGAMVCFEDGDSCAFGDQCCSGICAPDPMTGDLVCSPGCLQCSQPCTANTDCCANICDPITNTCCVPVE